MIIIVGTVHIHGVAIIFHISLFNQSDVIEIILNK